MLQYTPRGVKGLATWKATIEDGVNTSTAHRLVGMVPNGYTSASRRAIRVIGRFTTIKGTVYQGGMGVDIALKQVNGPIQNLPLSETGRVNVMYSKRTEKSGTLEKTPKRICIVH